MSRIAKLSRIRGMTTPEEAFRHLDARRRAVAREVVMRHLESDAALAGRLGEDGRERWVEYGERQVEYLAQAVRAGEPGLFVGFVDWLASVRAERGESAAALRTNLGILAEVVADQAPEAAELATACLRPATLSLDRSAPVPPSFLDGDYQLRPLAEAFTNALLAGDRRQASRLILEAADRGEPLRRIYLDVFQRSQRELGRLWQLNRITVAQEHFCTAATQLVISQLYPRLFTGRQSGPTLVATCVQGNLHELGIRTVADFFELEGWQTHYLGANTPHDAVAATVLERGADVLAISATLISQVAEVEALIAAVRDSMGTDVVRVLVGGAQFREAPQLSAAVGADATADDAEAAVERAAGLIAAP